jgi:exodeoxyribonuclease VII small subunit
MAIAKTYRELMEELETVMQALQEGDLDVDVAIEHYEKGMRLTKEIEAYLTNAENSLTKLRTTAGE